MDLLSMLSPDACVRLLQKVIHVLRGVSAPVVTADSAIPLWVVQEMRRVDQYDGLAEKSDLIIASTEALQHLGEGYPSLDEWAKVQQFDSSQRMVRTNLGQSYFHGSMYPVGVAIPPALQFAVLGGIAAPGVTLGMALGTLPSGDQVAMVPISGELYVAVGEPSPTAPAPSNAESPPKSTSPVPSSTRAPENASTSPQRPPRPRSGNHIRIERMKTRRKQSKDSDLNELTTSINLLIRENARLKRQLAKLQTNGGGGVAGLARIANRLRRALSDAPKPARNRKIRAARRSITDPVQLQRRRDALAKARAVRAANLAGTTK